MAPSYRIAILVGLVAAVTGCGSGGGGDDDVAADGAPVSEFSCQAPGADDGGEAFDLSLGLHDDAGYIDLADGDDAPLVIGYQGLYMLLLEGHAALGVDSDRVCLVCETTVSAAATGYGGTSQNGPIDFLAMPAGEFAGGSTVVLGPTSEADMFSGAQVDVTMVCSGHGFTGSVDRSVRLMTN